MPRRPSKNRSKTKTRPLDRKDARIGKWKDASDIPLDDEDIFHTSRDKVLLEEDGASQDDDNDDDEVFSLEGLNHDLEDEDEEIAMEEDAIVQKASVSNKKAGRGKKKGMDARSDESDEYEELDESWGRKKSSWYDSNAAQLESDDEEANELEEQEAMRLQNQAREEMCDADFGLDDIPDEQGLEETSVLTDPISSVIEPLPQDQKAILRHLEKTSPETLALARDWEDTIENLAKTQQKLATIGSESPHAPSLGMVHIHYQTLLTYSTVLAFYFYLRSSEKYAQRPELLRNHPILRRLLKLKQSLATLEDLDFDASDSGDSDEEDASWDITEDGEQLWKIAKKGGLDKDELRLLLEEASSRNSERERREPPRKKLKTSQAPKPVEPSPIFDLVEPDFEQERSKAPSLRVPSDSAITDVYGEASALHHVDAADKTARKKSLRFHTSKIESSSARRRGARNQAIGGDDDIPYRERRKERDARLAKEDVKNRGKGGEDLDDTEPEPRPAEKMQVDDVNDISEGPDGYYELVKKKSKERKEKKQEEYDAKRDAARASFDEEPTGGPRSLTRAILANKGLTPHRPKSVRNPRVKKRLKFDKAKKRLSSQKATYKGGLADTGKYEGERSGITKVVKSIRLG